MRRLAHLFALTLGCAATVWTPTAAAQRLKPAKPINCVGSRDIKLVGRIIKTPGTAIKIMGSCNVTLINSRIEAGVGIQLMGSGRVTLKSSQVIARKAAIELMGSSSVVGSSCVIKGGRVAIKIAGSGDMRVENCEVKGKVRRTGTGKYINNKGGSPTPPAVAPPTAEAKPPRGLKKSGAIRCQGNQDLVIRKRLIRTKGNAIVVQGKCDLLVDQCHVISEKGTAVLTQGAGDVKITRSWIQGRRAAIHVAGVGDVYAKTSTLKGAIRTQGNGDFHNQGGNTLSK